MKTEHAACCTTRNGQRLPLQAMRIEGTIQAPCAVFELTQTYTNAESTNIEAIYTFPLPVHAELLALQVTLASRVLVGRVTERAAAERRYEEALDQGDSAVMLEQVEPGLFTLNLGNLMPGERMDVHLRFALPLHWDRDRLRLALPTTVAPRYGHPAESGAQPHQVPEADALAEHRYSLALTIPGPLACGSVQSPTHRPATSIVDGQLRVVLEDALADRDFVLLLDAPAAARSGIVFGEHAGERAAHALFSVPSRGHGAPLDLKVLVDCSGSMQGDSIALARRAVRRAIARLQAGDGCALSRFGSTFVTGPAARIGAEPSPALDAFVDTCNADLGGTEMLNALRGAFAHAIPRVKPGPTPPSDLLLITDGESWSRNEIVSAARGAHHRIFVVGIGASPAEALVREIAESTGGAAVFVTPNEDVEATIDRHIERMRALRITGVTLHLDGYQDWMSPSDLARRIFAGDTVHVACGMGETQGTQARLAVTWSDGVTTDVVAPARDASVGGSHSDVARMAVAMRLREMQRERIGADEILRVNAEGVRTSLQTELAIRHQLIGPRTNYILVVERQDDAAQDLPELRQVRPMVAAGWGGSGSVAEQRLSAPAPMRAAGMQPLMERAVMSESLARRRAAPPPMDADASFDCLMAEPMDLGPAAAPARIPREVIERLNERFGLVSPERSVIRRLATSDGLIVQLDAASPVVRALHALFAAGWSEEDVVLAFWLALLGSGASDAFSRAHRRGILRATHQRPPLALADWMKAALRATSPERWSWTPVGAMPSPAAAVHP